jgi:signal transduction histidine kinase
LLDATRRREGLERERVQRLAELDLLKTDFVAIVAHELQTPIASIKTQAETLLAAAASRPQRRRGSAWALPR